ncbi:hypothetical protein NQ176_g4412 [Zarea fungicola]|uniref:Uncharacterized protein n=1 Tax=Zarea fungicola TaxID=93591 RepID=A0ACC1NEV4_9HYPO|nr:hypothetical protein NQ176_g4412 [Lecanicillium fungicola]
MGSLECATALELLQPEPPLRLNNSSIEKANYAGMAIILGNVGDTFPVFAERCLTPLDQEYFERTRSEWMGVGSIAELAADQTKTGEQGWKACEVGLQACVELLSENPKGPFVEGSVFGYVDCILASIWMMYKRVDEGLFQRIMTHDARIQEHYDACVPYLQRVHN